MSTDLVTANMPNLSKEAIDMLDFTVLPSIRYDGEVFKVRGAEWDVPKTGFDAIILSAKRLWYYRGADDHAIPGFYTYDDVMTTKGEPVSEILEIWKKDGIVPSKKEYVEVKAVMVNPQPKEIVMISISPTSVRRFWKYVSIDLQAVLGKRPEEVVTHFAPSKEKVRGANGRAYHTWSFSVAGA